MATVPLQANNRIWLTYQHFPYKAWNAVAELVDNSTQSYFDNRRALDRALKKERANLTVRIDLSKTMFSVWDNAMGMDIDDLGRAVQLAAPPPDTSGRSEFGMGMKTSCCWLGARWSIITKKLGSPVEYTVVIDVGKIAASDSHELEVTEKRAGADEHYTRIEVTNLYPRLQTKSQGKTKTNLVQIFRNDIEAGVIELYWNGERLEPPAIVPLVTEADGGKPTTWRKNIKFEVQGNAVDGTICILGEGQRGRDKAGFDLYRRGRVIVGRPFGYRPFTIFGESRNDVLNQRLYGQIHLDSFPVNHLKDDFLWDGLEEDFQQKLKDMSIDYIDFARRYKVRKAGEAGVGPAVVSTTNEEVAEELSEDEMAEQLEVVEIMPIPDEPDPAIVEAKAAKLRAQKIDPRIVEVGDRTIRIYHPQGMPDSDPYFFRQSAQDGIIDIFVNDNHPFVSTAVTDETDYLMFLRMCVLDAMVEHTLLRRQDAGFTATFPARLKDALLRGIKV